MKNAIYIVNTKNDIDEKRFSYLLGFADSKKHERIKRCRKRQDAVNMLIGDILCKIAVKKDFGINLQNQKIEYTPHGKPYLAEYPNIHFNISHSGTYVTCIVSSLPVGIDIQKICTYSPKYAHRIFTDDEIQKIETSTDKDSEFTKLWSQKEAVIKKYGLTILSADIKNCLKNEKPESQKIDGMWLSVSYTNI